MRSWANQSLSLLLWEGSTYFPYLVEGSHGLVNFLCAGSCARCFNAGRSQLARGEGHVYRWFIALWGIVLSRPLSGLLRGGRVKRSLGRVCMCWKCSLLRDGDILTCEPLWLPRCSYSRALIPLWALPSSYSDLESQCPNHSIVIIIVGLEGTLHRGACWEQVIGNELLCLPLLLPGVRAGLQSRRIGAGVGKALCVCPVLWG